MSELAQANVARLRASLDQPLMADFVGALDGINRLAETSAGFVWRLRTEHGHGLCLVTEDGGPAFLNVTVWESYVALRTFVYRGRHGQYVRHRAHWFESTRRPSTVLWWVPPGYARAQATRPDGWNISGRTARRRGRSRFVGASPRREGPSAGPADDRRLHEATKRSLADRETKQPAIEGDPSASWTARMVPFSLFRYSERAGLHYVLVTGGWAACRAGTQPPAGRHQRPPGHYWRTP